MKLDYTNMIQLVRIRQKQIKDVSLELENYNTEFVLLEKVEKDLAKLIVNQRIKDD